MKPNFVLWAILGLVLCGGCSSNDFDDYESTTAEGEGEPAHQGVIEVEDERIVQPEPIDLSHERTERRLQLERSLDQWWLAFQQQDYARSDGLAAAIEQFVNRNYAEVERDVASAPSPRFRKVAAAALGFSGRAEAVEPLVAALKDPFSDVVLASLLSLRMLALAEIEVPADRVTPFLGSGDPDVRANASSVLAHAVKKGQGELFLPLTAALEDEEPSVRAHVAAALGALGDVDAVPFLVKTLKDRMVLVRVRAAFALARIGDVRALPALVKALDDPSVDVSKAAHKALTAISGRDFERRREPWEEYLRRQHS